MPSMLPDVTCADLIGMVKGGRVLNAPPEVLMDIMLREGDDSLDCWQGIYWTIKNMFLLEKPALSNVRRSGVIIACGSGPSLQDNLERLRDLQNSAYIIAAESTTEILVENGIMPHMVTPLERVDLRTHCLDGTYNHAAYGGACVVPHEPHRFNTHYLLMANTPMTQWAGVKGLVPMSAVSGGQAVLNGMALAADGTADLYLVGQDLCVVDGADHTEGYAHNSRMDMPVAVECYDGKTRTATHEWARTAQHISGCQERFGSSRIYSVTEKGCKIGGVSVRGLPGPDECEPGVETILPGAHNPVDIGRLRSLVKALPHQLEIAIKRSRSARNIRQLDPDRLIDGPNKWLLSYLLQPLYAQISIERLAPFGNKGVAVEWFADAFESIYNGLYRSIKEVADVDGA